MRRLADQRPPHPKDKLRVQRQRKQALIEQLAHDVQVAEVVELDLRLQAGLGDARRNLLGVQPLVDEDVVAEVDRADVQGRHLRGVKPGQGERAAALINGHPDCPAGRGLDDGCVLGALRTAVADGADGSAEPLGVLARVARRIADVQVDDGGPGGDAAGRLLGRFRLR